MSDVYQRLLTDKQEQLLSVAKKAMAQQERINDLEAALAQFVEVANALIDNRSEINWSALQHNAIDAKLLLDNQQQQADEIPH